MGQTAVYQEFVAGLMAYGTVITEHVKWIRTYTGSPMITGAGFI